MKSFNKELSKHAEKTRLTASERHELRERILTYMEYHPLPKSARSISETVTARAFSRTQTILARVLVGAFAFVFIVVSVPIAAERAKPGDVLYLVKTRINENVRAQFVDSPYEKVVFETELMERRIAEARLLAKEGKLTKEQGAQIAESVKDQAGAVQRSISDLRESDADEAAIASITFGSSLEVQSALFGNTIETDDIANAVRQAKLTADAEKGTAPPSYGSLSARVEQSTTRVLEFFASVENAATVEEKEKIERRLSDIGRAIEAADRAHGTGEDAKAVELLSGVLGDIQKLILFMTDIDVRENVLLDTLVPIVLTPEERLILIQNEFADIESAWEAASSSEEAADVQEDMSDLVETILNEVPALIEIATFSLAAGDLEGAEAAIDSATALILEFKLMQSDESGQESAVDEPSQIQKTGLGEGEGGESEPTVAGSE